MARRKWGLPVSAKYRKETDASLALWSCRERKLKVRPRSQLHSGVAGMERSCCVSALQTPGNSSHHSTFARHFLYYLCLRKASMQVAAVPAGCLCQRALPAPFAVVPPAAFTAHLSTCFSCSHVQVAVGKPPPGRAGLARQVPHTPLHQGYFGFMSVFWKQNSSQPAHKCQESSRCDALSCCCKEYDLHGCTGDTADGGRAFFIQVKRKAASFPRTRAKSHCHAACTRESRERL